MKESTCSRVACIDATNYPWIGVTMPHQTFSFKEDQLVDRTYGMIKRWGLSWIIDFVKGGNKSDK